MKQKKEKKEKEKEKEKGKKGSHPVPLLDREKPLTCLMIAEILGLFLKCDPTISVVMLPDFRILELCEFAKCLPGRRNRVQNENVLEAIASFYCLCFYYGGSILYDDIDVARHAIAVIQCVHSECIMFFNYIGSVTIKHTDDRIRNMEAIMHDMKQQRREVFLAANDFLKEIIRDVIRQVRECRDPAEEQANVGKARKKSVQGEKNDPEDIPVHPPIDCFLMHSLYLSTTYALGHVASVQYTDNPAVKNFPGAYEAMLCTLHIDCSREGKKVRRTQKLKRRLNVQENDRYPMCLQLALCISYVVIKNCNINFVKQIRIVRGRLSRGKSTSRIDFARLKASGVESELLKKEWDHKDNLVVQSESDVVLPLQDRTSLTSDVFELNFKHRNVGAKLYISNVSAPIPDILVDGLEDVKKNDNDVRASSDEPSVDEEISNADVGLSEEYRDYDEMSNLHFYFRQYYILSREARRHGKNGPHFFNPTDKENRMNQLSKSKSKKLSQTEFETSDNILNELEQAYYDSSLNPWPRYLQQTEGLYWVCNTIIERLYHEIKEGRLFANINDRYLGALKSCIRKELSETKKNRVSSTLSPVHFSKQGRHSNPIDHKTTSCQAVPLSTKLHESKGALLTPVKSRKVPEVRPPLASTPIKKKSQYISPSISIKSSKDGVSRVKTMGALDLELRLKLARKEATLERKLEMMNENSQAEVNRLQRRRFQELEKKFSSTNFNDLDSIGTSTSISVRANNSNTCRGVSSQAPRDLLIATLEEASSTAALKRKGQRSVTWVPPPEVEDEMERRKRLQTKITDRDVTEESYELPPGSEAEVLEYGKKMKKQHEEMKKKAKENFQERSDLRDIELAFVKQLRQQQRAEERAAAREEISESLNIKKRAEAQKKELARKAKHAKKSQEKLLQQQNADEVSRVNDYKEWLERSKQREEEARKEREQLEEIRIKKMCDHKEHEEIIRRIAEEKRMKYLEGIQRKKEEKHFEMERQRAIELMKRQEEAKVQKEKILNDLRKSNFLYHNGKLGYYRDIRDEPLPFIQYEDDWGNPYYLDPMKNETTYDLPEDVSVIHHTEKERQDYDALYGEGAFEEVLADRAWKLQANEDKGYRDQNGMWVPLEGYFDENYEFVQTF